MSGPVTERDVRYTVAHKPALAALVETEAQWKLGPLWIEKPRFRIRIGWGCEPSAETRFRTAPFDLPDLGQRGVVVIFRSCDRDLSEELPIEWVLGWVPGERVAEAEAWVATLNRELERHVPADAPPSVYPAPLEPPSFAPAEVAARVRRTAPLAKLAEEFDEDGSLMWRLGEIGLSRDRATFECSGYDAGYGGDAHFFRRGFTHPETGRTAVAVFFHDRTRGVTRHDHLCGWVPLEREAEATAWVVFLNGEIDRVRALTASR